MFTSAIQIQGFKHCARCALRLRDIQFKFVINNLLNLLVVYRESVNLIGYITRRLSAEWAIDSEAMRARGINFLVKSNQLIKKISRLNIFHKLKLDFNPFLRPKHCKYGGHFSLLVGYNI